MKHINDDPNYAAHLETHNELARKKQAADAEINQIYLDLSSAPSVIASPEDTIRQGLAIEPGTPSEDGIQSKRDRLGLLQKHSDQLRKAIDASGTKTERIQREAAYRVYAANAAPYLKLADQLVAQVEAIVATTEALKTERQNLAGRGVAEPPLVDFPEYGFGEQLPAWLRSLRDAVYRARLTQQTYAAASTPQP